MSADNLERFAREESVFMKLHAFNLTQFEKILLVDSDQIVRSYDELFEDFDVPAFGPETATGQHHLTSNMMLLTPSEILYVDLLRNLGKLPSYDSADQGFFNSYFSDFRQRENLRDHSRHVIPWHKVAWRRSIERYPELWSQYENDILGVDCSGPSREIPWMLLSGQNKRTYGKLYDKWWRDYLKAVQLTAPYRRSQYHTSYQFLKIRMASRKQ